MRGTRARPRADDAGPGAGRRTAAAAPRALGIHPASGDAPLLNQP
ncbi:hypothetical protein [Streptomyces sp. NPDC051554]